ncbi:amino acid permease [Limnohabitans sp.]|uniref:amino acid permease n=1 Tax=Limnohabitans sp. TaxID=1907725 RepID=UPI002AFE4D20|nr:amino acid permease [Limnohabitans sp.]
MSSLFRRKSFTQTNIPLGLKRSMGRWTLLCFSTGSIIGSGIFVILGAAIEKAGPAVLISFAVAALAALLSALSYAELASKIPSSGSSYSYAYVTLGEIVAWSVGWMLMLEYGVAVAAVAVGWGEYLNVLLASVNMAIPPDFANPPGQGGVFNVPAFIVVVACGLLLIRGASESAMINTLMVFLKIVVLIFFCCVAATAFDANKLTPFAPLGVAGIVAAAGQVFFSYIGFDAASTAAEEAHDPQRDLPFAIVGSVLLVTILYLLVALAAVGTYGWEGFASKGAEAALASVANSAVGGTWAGNIIALGAVVSIFSVVLVVMYGQTRILMAMARDGLLPKIFAKVHARTQTPVTNTLIVTLLIALPAALVPMGQLAEATSIGTLGAFAVVNVGVMVLRRQRSGTQAGFRMPLYPLIPLLALVLIAVILAGLDTATWLAFLVWMTLGMVFYFAYSRRHSELNNHHD